MSNEVPGLCCPAHRHSPSFGLPDMCACLAGEAREDPVRIAVDGDPVPERTARAGGACELRPDLYPPDARGLTHLLESGTEPCFVLRSRDQGRAVVGERQRYPLRLAAQVAHLDHRQAGPDLPGRVAGRHREGAETVATGDQSAPVRVMKRRRRRLPGYEIGPARIGQLQHLSTAYAVIDPDVPASALLARRMDVGPCRRQVVGPGR